MPTTLHYIRGRFRSHVKTQAKVHSRGKSRTTWGCKLHSIGSSWATKTMASNEQMEKIGTFNSEHFDLHERGGVTFSPSALARKALRRDTHRRRPWPSSTTNAAIFLHYPPSSKKPPPPLSSTSAACTLRSGRLPSSSSLSSSHRSLEIPTTPSTSPLWSAGCKHDSPIKCELFFEYYFHLSRTSHSQLCLLSPYPIMIHLSSLSLHSRIEHGLRVVV